MTWKDKFAIFCVKGERLIVKNKKKRIIGLIILVLIILTAGIFIFGHNRINSQKNEKKSLETKSECVILPSLYYRNTNQIQNQ